MAVYPRKQTVVTLVVCILIVGGVAFSVRGENPSFFGTKAISTNAPTNLDVYSQEVLPFYNDWRKQFLDKNATSTSFKSAAPSTVPTPTEKLTTTDLLGRSILTRYVELRQTGLNNDSKSVESVVNQLTTESLASIPKPKTYFSNDVIVASNSSVTLTTYSKIVLKTLASYLPKINELEIMSQAYENNDMTQLKQIDPVIANYKTMISALLATPVPSPLIQHHVTLLNGVSMALYNAESFRNAEADPIRSLAATSLAPEAIQNIYSAVSGMNDYFIATGIQTGS